MGLPILQLAGFVFKYRYASIQGVGFLMWPQTSKKTAMTSARRSLVWSGVRRMPA